MNNICAFGSASVVCLFSMLGSYVIDGSKMFALADSSSNTNQESVIVAADEEISSYKGEDKSDILVKGGSVSWMDLHDSAAALIEKGEVGHVYLYDTSLLKLSGNRDDTSASQSSSVSFVHLHDSAAASVKGGEISHVHLHDESSLKLSGTSEISHLTLNDSSQSEISGGQLSFLNLTDDSEAHVWLLDIEGGKFSTPEISVSGGAITIEPGTALHIYGREIRFADGKLSGIWANGTQFEFWLLRNTQKRRFWLFKGDEEDRHTEIPSSLPKEVIFHQTKN